MQAVTPVSYTHLDVYKRQRLGSPVFCFQESGMAYHTADCRIVERYYVEIEKGKAEEQGYTPCSKCGGGQ